jgi:hypothetical protein
MPDDDDMSLDGGSHLSITPPNPSKKKGGRAPKQAATDPLASLENDVPKVTSASDKYARVRTASAPFALVIL